jgi:hypothetical protein
MESGEFEREYNAIVDRALMLSEKARKEGLLVLEDVIDHEKEKQRDILEYGMRFVIDGTDIGFIDRILSNITNLETDGDKRLLKTIQKDAVLAIQQGLNPILLVALLNSHVSIGIEESLKKFYTGNSDGENSDVLSEEEIKALIDGVDKKMEYGPKNQHNSLTYYEEEEIDPYSLIVKYLPLIQAAIPRIPKEKIPEIKIFLKGLVDEALDSGIDESQQSLSRTLDDMFLSACKLLLKAEDNLDNALLDATGPWDLCDSSDPPKRYHVSLDDSIKNQLNSTEESFKSVRNTIAMVHQVAEWINVPHFIDTKRSRNVYTQCLKKLDDVNTSYTKYMSSFNLAKQLEERLVNDVPEANEIIKELTSLFERYHD